MKYSTFSLGVLFASLTVSIFAAELTVVGKVSFSKGSNAAQQPNVAARLLGKDAEIYQGDNIQTSDASFVIVDFNDGSKVTVRPNSNFKIEQFDTASKNAKLTIYEGGVRASTGEFAKAGSDNFQIKTPTATLKGEKDSDYSVNVCKENCDKDNKDKSETAKDTSVARIVDIKGDVYAQNRANKNTNERKLTMGMGLEAQDFLTSQPNSYAVMVFRDGEKVTLQPSSELDIVKYDFQQAGKKDQILLKLAAGGMRALTGSIGKKDHSAYALDTPVATIGIRGTESETMIDDFAGAGEAGSGGLYNHVTEGAISVKNETGEVVLNQGESSFTSSPTASTVQVPSLPAKITTQLSTTPSPKSAPDAEKAFESKPPASSKSGSYVTVNKGSGKLESNLAKADEKDDKNSKGNKDSSGSEKGSGDKRDDKSNALSQRNDSGRGEQATRDDKTNAPPPPSNNDDSGSGRGQPPPQGGNGGDGNRGVTMLAAGESSFAGAAGDMAKLDSPPPTFDTQFDMPPNAFDNNAPPPMFSPINDLGGKGGGAGCVVE